MSTLAELPLFAPPTTQDRAQRAKSRRRTLTVAPPLERAYATRGAYVRALLQEFGAARDCERRAKTYAAKPTTSAHERFTQSELAAHHHARQETVILTLLAMLA